MARERTTVRGVILDPTGAVLLQATMDARVERRPGVPAHVPIWILPGGGVERGETLAEALTRELREETGFEQLTWGAWVWRREVTLRFEGEERRFVEHYRLARVPEAAPVVHPAALEPHERASLRGHRWWTSQELRAIAAPLFPPRLADLLDHLPTDGVVHAQRDISALG